MRAHDDDVGALGDRGSRQIRVEAEVGTPGGVDDQCRTCFVGHLGEGFDVGDGTEVARGHEVDGGHRFGVAADGLAQCVGGDAMGDTVDLVDVGVDEAGVESGQHDAVDEARMCAALGDDSGSEGADGQGGHPVALRGAVGEEPGAAGAPGFGGQAQGFVLRGIDAEVDSVEERGDVQGEGVLAEEFGLTCGDAFGRASVPGGGQEQRIAVGRVCQSFRIGRAGLREGRRRRRPRGGVRGRGHGGVLMHGHASRLRRRVGRRE